MRRREVQNTVARISLPRLNQKVLSRLAEYDDVISLLFSLASGSQP